MFRTVFAGICLFAMTACGSGTDQDTGTGTGGGGTTDPDVGPNGIPSALNVNLHGATYNASAGTLTLNMVSLDAGPVVTTYNRNVALDVGPYQAYTYQDDPLDRHFTALVAQSIDPSQSVRAGVVADGGQFNRYFPGAFYERDGGFTPPSNVTGLVSYAGVYSGVTNVSAPGADLRPVPASVDPSRRPNQSARTQGHIFLDVNFSDNSINGNIINRSLVDYGTALPNVVLIRAEIDGNGEFLGTTEYGDLTANGNYGGIFGGTNASAVGGIVALESFDGPNDTLGLTEEEERGVFVLVQCGLPGDDPICANVNP